MRLCRMHFEDCYMSNVLTFISGLILTLLTLITLSFCISSIWEKEKRATIIACILTLVLLVICFIFYHLYTTGFFNSGTGYLLMVIGLASAIAIGVLLLLPIGANPEALEGTSGLITGDVTKVDERDTVFSRQIRERMESGEESSAKPQKPANPDKFRGSAVLSMAHASDSLVSGLATPEFLFPEVSEKRIELSPEEASIRVRGYAKRLGAVLVGITEINPLWLYSNRGKSGSEQGEWGREISLDHKYAIVYADEMDFDMVATGPHSPVLMESLFIYAKSAFVGSHLAAFIANLGYPAHVNQMAHYDAMMVPLAVDAGLGELSRMGYLITKEYGPRVRLGVVTTSLPLIPDKPVDIGVVDFCRKCMKCVRCCPTRTIPSTDREPVNGSLRWTIDTDLCYRYWKQMGTDCGICMRVCPWSHARTFPHKLITSAVCRNSISRTMFNWMDDLFYGKKPPVKDPPDWAGYGSADDDTHAGDLIT